MMAVVLAGGRGTRLRPYTTVLPKPLVPIGDRPVLEHLIRSLTNSGVDRIDLCVNHLGELILVYLANADLPRHLDLRFHWERDPLGTVGAVGAIPDLTGTFIVANGDILTTLDYCALVDYHRDREAALTIAMHDKLVSLDLGVIETRDGFVRTFTEKPTLRCKVSMGLYVYEAHILQYLPGGTCQFPELVERLLDAGERVAAYENDADWYDIGTVGEYERASAEVERHPEKFGFEPLPHAETEVLTATRTDALEDEVAGRRAVRLRR
jgi:NDP-sugar pyrophosphorylase family protein